MAPRSSHRSLLPLFLAFAAALPPLLAACGGDSTGTGGAGTDATSGTGATGTGGAGGTGGTGGSGASPCAPQPISTVVCTDVTEQASGGTWSHAAEDNAATTLTFTSGGPSGDRVVSVDTQSGFGFSVRWQAPAPIDASSAEVLQLAVRASNVNAWQVNAPVVTLEDEGGARRTISPIQQHFPSDGVTWEVVAVPLSGGPGWDVSGAAIDLGHVRAIEVATDTWDYGFSFDLDAVSFRKAGEVCEASCPNDCSGRGTCDPAALRCRCDVGAEGPDCGACGEGFVSDGAGCKLEEDGDYDTWPNPVSHTNGDPWLAVHHDAIATLSPKLLVLHFVNKSDPAQATIVDDVIAGFADGSRRHAYLDPSAKSQLTYAVDKLVDLRDGVLGRPPAPAGWQYDNSTLYPRKSDGGNGQVFDYAALFSPTFAALYAYPDPDSPGQFLDLCGLVERGVVHEVWIVASGDVASDASAYEVLESKQRYTAEGNKIPGAFEACAGNGCFSADVPVCKRSVRVGFVNYNRGPGCYMHSQGHGIESLATHRAIPALSEWLLRFAALDLDTRYGLPFGSLYGLDCPNPPCVAYDSPTKATFTVSGQPISRDPFDAVCGNVHFPPNGRQHYDYAGPDAVLSTCAAFGENGVACGEDTAASVTSDLWAAYETAHGDCGGGFLTWWYQSMPAHGSKKTLADGRPMRSMWPYLFY